MFVSAIVPGKSRGNEKCDKEEEEKEEEEEEKEEEEEEEERHIFGIAVKWLRHGCMQLC